MYASNSYYGNYLGEWLGNGEALSPVSGNFPVSWGILSTTSVQTNFTITYSLLNSAQASNNIRWDMAGNVTKTFNIRYTILIDIAPEVISNLIRVRAENRIILVQKIKEEYANHFY